MTCEACGKTLGDEAFTVTVSLTDARTGLPRTIEVPVCDEACGKRYMLDIRSALMLSMKVDRVS